MTPIDTTTAVEAAKTAVEFDIRVGGLIVTITAVMTKLIDKLPWGKIFGGSKKVPVYKTDMDLAIADASAGTEIATINSILAALRAHGLIAT